MAAAARQPLRVFVANLPWTIGSTELRQFASSYGPVTFSQVVFNKKTGMSKGYGFVTFGNRDGFNAITKGSSATYFLEGNHITVSASANANAANQNSGSVNDD